MIGDSRSGMNILVSDMKTFSMKIYCSVCMHGVVVLVHASNQWRLVDSIVTICV